MKKILFTFCVALGVSAAAFAQTPAVEPEEQYRTTNDPKQIVIGASSLPDQVRATLDEKFPGSVMMTYRHDLSQDQKELGVYEVELLKNQHTFKAYIDDEGKFLRKEEVRAAK